MAICADTPETMWLIKCASGCSASISTPGTSWSRGRYEGPHLRDLLIDRGILVETLETAHTYTRIGELYAGVSAALRGAEIEQWRELKAAACGAIVSAGGTITHHHAVGRDHAPYMRSEVGELGIDVLGAVKEELDPTGIMNPGKLLS